MSHSIIPEAGPAAVAFLALAFLGGAAAAGEDPLRFWRPERRSRQQALEARLLATASASRLRAGHDLVSREPHVAGSPGDARVVSALAAAFAEMGLEVERQELRLQLPRPVRAELEIMAPRRRRLPVKEGPLPGDPWSGDARIDVGWNAWSGSGEAEGRVVYANYGTKEDFARLRALAVDVRSRVVLVRYGRVHRGQKVRFAQEAGAAGVVLYTDPADGAYLEGTIQRGSVLTLPYAGDPFTPFESVAGEAKWLDASAIRHVRGDGGPDVDFGGALELAPGHEQVADGHRQVVGERVVDPRARPPGPPSRRAAKRARAGAGPLRSRRAGSSPREARLPSRARRGGQAERRSRPALRPHAGRAPPGPRMR